MCLCCKGRLPRFLLHNMTSGNPLANAMCELGSPFHDVIRTSCGFMWSAIRFLTKSTTSWFDITSQTPSEKAKEKKLSSHLGSNQQP